MIIFYFFLIFVFLESNYSLLYFLIFLPWRFFFNNDFIVLKIFLKKPQFFINKLRLLKMPDISHRHPLIFYYKSCDLPQSNFFLDFFFFFIPPFKILLLNYIWQPIFKKHSYYAFFKSNRNHWLTRV